MKKSTGFLFIFLIYSFLAFSQQEQQVSHNMFNNMFINPAFAGSSGEICATGLIRQQWVGFKGEDKAGNMVNVAPATYLFSMHAPVRLLHGGFGGSIFQDQAAFFQWKGVRLDYAYRFNIGEGNLAFGLQVGFLNTTLDVDKLKPVEDDPILAQKGKQSAMFMDFGLGAFYQIPSKLYVGLSTDQITQNEQTLGLVNMQLKRHYYLIGGYNYVLPAYPAFEINPSLFIKTDGVSTQYDLNGLVKYNGKFWAGLTYRVQDAVAVLLGVNFRNFHIGYSYDITTSKVSKVSSGSHEVMVGYCFKIEIEKPRQSYKNTRFL